MADGTVNYNKNSVFHQRKEIYRGSVSVVYKAHCQTTCKTVIVKAYKVHRMNSKQIHKAKREIDLMKRLRCDPGVVHYLGHFEDAYMTFIVMEYCKQGDMFRNLFLKGGTVEENWAAVNVVQPLLDTLSRLHAQHIIHRDIKPENLFLNEDWQLRLGDLGLAIDASKELPFTRSGTLDYMAPEVLVNPATDLTEGLSITRESLASKGVTPYNEKVDIWAVGILAYELVVGRPPFEVDNEQYTMKLIINSNNINYPSNSSMEWQDFVTLALSKDPEKRPSATNLLCHPWILKHTERSGVMHSKGRLQYASMSAAATSTNPSSITLSKEMESLSLQQKKPVAGAFQEFSSMPVVAVRTATAQKGAVPATGVLEQRPHHLDSRMDPMIDHETIKLEPTVDLERGICNSNSNQTAGPVRWGSKLKQYLQRQMSKPSAAQT